MLIAEGPPLCRRMLRDLACIHCNGPLGHSILSLDIEVLLT